MSKYDKEREAMGIKPVASSSSSSGKSKYAQERESYQHIDTQPTFADKLQSGAMPNMDIRKSPLMEQVQAQPIVPEKTSWNSIVDNPIVHGAGTVLDTIGTGFDMFERATGLKNIGSAVKGLVDPQQYYKPDESHGNSYMGNLQNIGSEALATIKNAGRSAYEGLIHPNQTDQQFQTDLNASTANLDPVTKYSARYLGNAGTDPLTFIPIPISPVIKAIRGARGAAESRLIGKAVKDAKSAEGATTSKYAAERETAQTPVNIPESNVPETSRYTEAEKNLDDLYKQAEDYHAGLGAENPSNEIFNPESPFNSKMHELQDAVRRAKNEVYNSSPAPVPKKLTGTLTGLGDNGSISKRQIKEPTALDDLVKSKGFTDVNPETIAQTYNKKKWYHGTGNANLTADQLDPNVGNHESLFGQGVYLTDNPSIAEGYANSRGKRTGTPTIYETNVNTNRVLDLEKPVTPDVVDSVEKSFGPSLDYLGESKGYDKGHFTNLIRAEAAKPGMTAENLIKKVQQEISDFSHEEGISTNEFTENFQDFATYLKESGYDGITHTGGLRTGNDPHRVLIMLDPQNWHGAESLGKTVTKFEKYVKPQKPEPIAPTRKLSGKMSGLGDSGNISKSKVQDMKASKYAAEREAIQTPPDTAPDAPVQKQNWFTNLFGDQGGLGITPFGSKKRLSEKPLTSKDAIVSKGLVNSNEGIMNSAKSQLETAYTAIVDDLSPFKMVSHDAKETAMDSRRANNLANNIIREKFVTPEGKVVGPSMADTFLKVARGKGKDFVDYLIKRDAIDRVGQRGERVYDDSVKVYDPDTRQLVSLNDEKVLKREVAKDETKYPEFKDLGQEWNRFNDNMLQHYGVDMGMLTPEAKAAMQTARPNYIKTMRQFSLSEKPLKNITAKTRSGFSGQNLPIKRATGSGRNIVDPRKTMAEAVGGFVNASMRNRAMQEVYKEVVANPEKFKGVVEVVEESADASMKTLDEINKVITEDGMAGLTDLFDSGYEAALKKGAQQGKDNVVTVMVEGKPVKLRVYNPSLINAVTGMGPQATSLLSNVLGAFSRATKRGATGLLAPTFITKSAIMDFPQAILQSKNPIQQAGLSVYAVLSGIGDKLNIPGLRDMAREYRLAGGEFSPALKGESKLNKNVMDMTRYPILSGKNVIKQGLRTVSAPFKALEAAGSVLENAPRIAASKIVLNKANNVKTAEVVRNAMSAGREATVNYLRKGRIGNEFENVVPYSNAAVQGTYRILKGFKDNPVRTIAAIGTLSVLPKMYEYMHFSDDPDYQKLPARERMRYLIVHKNEDGSFTKIPMDPAYNSFGEMTIEALRKFKDKDPQAFKGTADALANAWTPPFVTGALQGATLGTGAEGSIVGALNSTVAAPAVAIASNKSFTGAPIEPASVAGNSKGERYTDQTSDIAKAVGKKIGLSPLKTDYLLRSYGGDASRLGLPFNSNVGAGTPRNTLLKNFIVDPVLTNTLTNDYYGYKTRLNEVYQDNKDHDVPLPAWYDDNLRKEISSTAKGSLSSQVKDLTDQKKAVSANTLLSATEKAIKIRELQSQINKMYLDINAKLSQKGVPTQ